METVIQIIETPYFRLGLRAVILIAFIVAAYNLVIYFRKYSRLASNIQGAYLHMQESEKVRMDKDRIERALKGAGAEKGILEKFDEMIVYSGLKDIHVTQRTKSGKIIIHRFTTEIGFMLMIAILSLSIVASVSITKSPLIGVAVAIIVIVIMLTGLKIACYLRNRAIEDQMIKFMNLLENFSTSRDDIIDVLRGAASYLEKPLGPIIYDACVQAEMSGSSTQALQSLEDRVSSKYFKQLIHNLELSSHFEANYTDVVRDIRDIYKAYSKVDKEKNQVKIGGAVQTAAIILIGFFCIWLLGDVTGEGNILYALRMGGTVGNILLIWLIVAAILAFYVGIIKVLLD